MIPAFEIYFSILSDAWMPWLEENTCEERFEPIVQYGQINLQEASPAYFNGLLKVFKHQKNFCPDNVLYELALLASFNRSKAGSHLTREFLNQPAHSAREVFYLVVTGQCLGAYYDWCNRVVHDSEETLRTFYLDKTLNRLHNLLLLAEPARKLPVSDLLPVIRVKLALLVLFQKVRETGKGEVTGVLAFFNAADWLGNYLEPLELPQKTVNSIHDLFQQLVKRPTSKKSVSYEPVMKGSNELMEKPAEALPETEFAPLINDLQQDFSDIKQLLSRKNTIQPPLEYIGSSEVMKLLNISKSTLQRRRKEGIIKYIPMGGKTLYSKAHIESILKSGHNKF